MQKTKTQKNFKNLIISKPSRRFAAWLAGFCVAVAQLFSASVGFSDTSKAGTIATKSDVRAQARRNKSSAKANKRRQKAKEARFQRLQEYKRRKAIAEKRRREAKKEAASAAKEKKIEEESSAPSVTVFGGIGGSVYLFESAGSFEPDFYTGSANLGISGTHSYFGGKLSTDVIENGDKIGVSAAYITAETPFGLKLKLGRDYIPGVSSYVASLNHFASSAGNADGLVLSQNVTIDSKTSFHAELGVVNALGKDASAGFANRASNENRGYFAAGGLTLGHASFDALYAAQNNQIQVENDSATENHNEEKLADHRLMSFGAGLTFTNIQAGGFYSSSATGEEVFTIEAEAPEGVEKAALSGASEKETFGGGVKLNTSSGVFSAGNDSAALNLGVSRSSTLSSAPAVEDVYAASVHYSYGSAAFGLHGVHKIGEESAYTDDVTGESFDTMQKVSISFGYTFSK